MVCLSFWQRLHSLAKKATEKWIMPTQCKKNKFWTLREKFSRTHRD